jgi:hypothetical protein
MTTGRLGLGLVSLEGDALGSSALLARDRNNRLFLDLGNDGFGPKRLVERSTASILGTAATTWSTDLACDVDGMKILAKHQVTKWWALQ